MRQRCAMLLAEMPRRKQQDLQGRRHLHAERNSGSQLRRWYHDIVCHSTISPGFCPFQRVSGRWKFRSTSPVWNVRWAANPARRSKARGRRSPQGCPLKCRAVSEIVPLIGRADTQIRPCGLRPPDSDKRLEFPKRESSAKKGMAVWDNAAHPLVTANQKWVVSWDLVSYAPRQNVHDCRFDFGRSAGSQNRST